MTLNGTGRYVKIWIDLLPEDAGGRHTPLDLSTEWPVAYCPRLRVHGGTGRLVDVAFVAGPSDPVRPGAGAAATIRVPAVPSDEGADEIVNGAEFDIVEGPRIVGRGRVVACL